MNIDRNELRALVREVVREAVAGLRSATPQPPGTTAGSSAPPTVAAAPPPAPAPSPSSFADQAGLQPTGPRAVEGRNRTETVQLSNDRDLDNFVRKLLRLFDSPKTRADLKTGRLSFRLAGSPGSSAGGAVHRIESGAVTERQIAELAGGTLVLGHKAVLTPLAREKARALGVRIEKERR